LWCDMIFIQLVVCFSSPRQGSDIENHHLLDKNYHITKHGRSYIYRLHIDWRVGFFLPARLSVAKSVFYTE
jgi:hypothetical protein